MQVRRVVTGIDKAGRSVFLSDSHAPNSYVYKHIEGGAIARLWRTETSGTLAPPSDEPTALTGDLLPSVGGSAFMILQFGPDSAAMAPDFDPAAAGEEFMTYNPDLAALVEPDSPGMHTSETIDYVLILEGEVWLELDEGAETCLSAGDVVVQLGPRHAWRNKSERPAKLAITMVGAQRAC
ncbi:cupin domain-containing protein [Rhodococcus wratislaviensis]|nr:cupin domain-containing protein [Rhodococcus wratislaviensis]